MVSTTTLADRLRVVPTFTIVDTKGVPFMVVGEDAKVTGYFFTTYGEANRLLTLAKTSADSNIRQALAELRAQRRKEKLPALSKQEEMDQVGVNPWKFARISTVPLDVAVTLVTKSMYSGKKSSSGNYFQVAPAESDVEDALALDKNGKDELAEGRVPLFYFADFELMHNDGDLKQSPLYFRKVGTSRGMEEATSVGKRDSRSSRDGTVSRLDGNGKAKWERYGPTISRVCRSERECTKGQTMHQSWRQGICRLSWDREL